MPRPGTSPTLQLELSSLQIGRGKALKGLLALSVVRRHNDTHGAQGFIYDVEDIAQHVDLATGFLSIDVIIAVGFLSSSDFHYQHCHHACHLYHSHQWLSPPSSP